jgi:SAM-dependent methyltransferase
MSGEQKYIDKKNSEFWDELCGTNFARTLGIQDFSPESLKKYDKWYFSFYPYLQSYFDQLPKGEILEIGLGYGTASSYLATRSVKYFGLDIARGPVDVVNKRLSYLKKEPTARVGSAHYLPFPDQSLDGVSSIGCFHHTGDVEKCIEEAYRVLKPGGTLLFMCYNRRSIRMLLRFPLSVFFSTKDPIRLNATGSSLYDMNSEKEGAPFTELGSAQYYQSLCSRFSEVSVHKENWNSPRRKRWLNNIAKILGLDLYVVCRK